MLKSFYRVWRHMEYKPRQKSRVTLMIHVRLVRLRVHIVCGTRAISLSIIRESQPRLLYSRMEIINIYRYNKLSNGTKQLSTLTISHP